MRRPRSAVASLALLAALLTGLLAATPAGAASSSATQPAYAPDAYRCAGDPLYASSLWMCTMRPVTITYRGWGRMRSNGIGVPVAAYSWRGNGWTATSLADGTRVYVYPFTATWTWAWTAQSGWVAAPAANVTASTGGWTLTLRPALR